LRADGDNAIALLGEFAFHIDMGHRSMPDLIESLGAALDE